MATTRDIGSAAALAWLLTATAAVSAQNGGDVSQTPQRQQDRAERQAPQPPSGQAAADSPRPTNLDELEAHPDRYVGQQVSVFGEIQEVIGPRTFTIDEQNWIDFDGETLVVLPKPLAVMVRDNQAVRVTGTVTPYVEAEIDRGWGWFDDVEIEAELRDRAVIVADTVVTPAGVTVVEGAGTDPGARDRAGSIAGSRAPAPPPPIADAGTLAQASDVRMVGRRVDLTDAIVSGVDDDGRGFWVGQREARLYVLPADENPTVQTGDKVAIQGSVLQLPRSMRERLGAAEESIYVYARVVEVG